jgi:hypothetical protein
LNLGNNLKMDFDNCIELKCNVYPQSSL